MDGCDRFAGLSISRKSQPLKEQSGTGNFTPDRVRPTGHGTRDGGSCYVQRVVILVEWLKCAQRLKIADERGSDVASHIGESDAGEVLATHASVVEAELCGWTLLLQWAYPFSL